MPRLAKDLISQCYVSADNGDTREVAQQVILASWIQQGIDQTDSDRACGGPFATKANIDVTAAIATKPEARPKEINTFRCEFTLDQRVTADGKCGLGHGPYGRAFLIHQLNIQDPDIKRTFPTRPGQDGLAHAKRNIAAPLIDSGLDIGAEETDRNWALGELPRNEYYQQCYADREPTQKMDKSTKCSFDYGQGYLSKIRLGEPLDPTSRFPQCANGWGEIL
tara:strand:+ start:1019 stop:1684 length:666 start_codon:yes stop_codon:yes gene_type:complete